MHSVSIEKWSSLYLCSPDKDGAMSMLVAMTSIGPVSSAIAMDVVVRNFV